MALQTFTAGQVLTAAQVNALQANDYNQTVSNKTDSYVLVAADKGTRVVMNKATATTITVNTSLFNAGDTLFIQNIGAGVCTITAGTATVSTAGSLALAQNAGGTLYFTSTGVSIFFPSAVAASASGLTLISTTSFSAVASQSLPASTFTSAYKNYQVVFRGTQSAQIDLNLRVRAAGTDLTSGIYKYSTYLNTSGTPAVSTQNGNSNTSISLVGGGVQSAYYILDINDIFLTKRTAFLWRGQMMISSANDSYNMTGAAQVYDELSYDSLTIFPGSGTITGSISVYGRSE